MGGKGLKDVIVTKLTKRRYGRGWRGGEQKTKVEEEEEEEGDQFQRQ